MREFWKRHGIGVWSDGEAFYSQGLDIHCLEHAFVYPHEKVINVYSCTHYSRVLLVLILPEKIVCACSTKNLGLAALIFRLQYSISAGNLRDFFLL